MIHLIDALLTDRLQQIGNLKHVGYYTGQDAQGQDGKLAFSTPAAFLEYLPVDWNTMHRNVQEAELTFRVRILTLNYQNRREAYAPLPSALAQMVYLRLHGYSARLSDTADYASIPDIQDHTLIGSIQRVRSQPDHSQSNMQRYVETYRCAIYDATKRINRVAVSPNFEADTNAV